MADLYFGRVHVKCRYHLADCYCPCGIAYETLRQQSPLSPLIPSTSILHAVAWSRTVESPKQPLQLHLLQAGKIGIPPLHSDLVEHLTISSHHNPHLTSIVISVSACGILGHSKSPSAASDNQFSRLEPSPCVKRRTSETPCHSVSLPVPSYAFKRKRMFLVRQEPIFRSVQGCRVRVGIAFNHIPIWTGSDSRDDNLAFGPDDARSARFIGRRDEVCRACL